MSPQDDHQLPLCGHEAARLIPWFVVGALSARDAQRVQSHLRECALCAADEKRERRVHALVDEDPAIEHAPQPGLQRLMGRIEELEREMPGTPRVEASDRAQIAMRPRVLRWLVAAVVVQAVGMGIMGIALWNRGAQMQEPRFQTLSAEPRVGEGPQVRVVFAQDVDLGAVQSLLSSVPATIIDGPSAAGVYTLELNGGDASLNLALIKLRTSPGVLFAEPRVAGAATP